MRLRELGPSLRELERPRLRGAGRRSVEAGPGVLSCTAGVCTGCQPLRGPGVVAALGVDDVSAASGAAGVAGGMAGSGLVDAASKASRQGSTREELTSRAVREASSRSCIVERDDSACCL